MARSRIEKVETEFNLAFDDFMAGLAEEAESALGVDFRTEDITVQIDAEVDIGHRGTREDPPENPSVDSLKIIFETSGGTKKVIEEKNLTMLARIRLENHILTEWGEGAWVP